MALTVSSRTAAALRPPSPGTGYVWDQAKQQWVLPAPTVAPAVPAKAAPVVAPKPQVQSGSMSGTNTLLNTRAPSVESGGSGGGGGGSRAVPMYPHLEPPPSSVPPNTVERVPGIDTIQQQQPPADLYAPLPADQQQRTGARSDMPAARSDPGGWSVGTGAVVPPVQQPPAPVSTVVAPSTNPGGWGVQQPSSVQQTTGAVSSQRPTSPVPGVDVGELAAPRSGWPTDEYIRAQTDPAVPAVTGQDPHSPTPVVDAPAAAWRQPSNTPAPIGGAYPTGEEAARRAASQVKDRAAAYDPDLPTGPGNMPLDTPVEGGVIGSQPPNENTPAGYDYDPVTGTYKPKTPARSVGEVITVEGREYRFDGSRWVPQPLPGEPPPTVDDPAPLGGADPTGEEAARKAAAGAHSYINPGSPFTIVPRGTPGSEPPTVDDPAQPDLQHPESPTGLPIEGDTKTVNGAQYIFNGRTWQQTSAAPPAAKPAVDPGLQTPDPNAPVSGWARQVRPDGTPIAAPGATYDPDLPTDPLDNVPSDTPIVKPVVVPPDAVQPPKTGVGAPVTPVSGKEPLSGWPTQPTTDDVAKKLPADGGTGYDPDKPTGPDNKPSDTPVVKPTVVPDDAKQVEIPGVDEPATKKLDPGGWTKEPTPAEPAVPKTPEEAAVLSDEAAARIAELLGQEGMTTLQDTLMTQLNDIWQELGFNPDEYRSSQTDAITARYDEARARLARQFGISPGGSMSGDAQRQFEILEASMAQELGDLDQDIADRTQAVRESSINGLTNALNIVAGNTMDAAKLGETTRQFNEDLALRLSEFGLNEQQTEAAIRQINSNIANSTRELTANIQQSWAALTGDTGAPGTITMEDLGLTQDVLAGMSDNEVSAYVAQNIEALTGQPATTEQIRSLMRDGTLEVDGAPTAEMRQFSATMVQQNLDRVARYDAIADQLNLDRDQFTQAQTEADRAWDVEMGNIAGEYGLPETGFRFAKALYDNEMDSLQDRAERDGWTDEQLNTATQEALQRYATSLDTDVSTFMTASEQFDLRYGNALAQTAAQLGMQEEQYALAQRAADRVDSLQVATLASVMSRADRTGTWYLSAPDTSQVDYLGNPVTPMGDGDQDISWAVDDLDTAIRALSPGFIPNASGGRPVPGAGGVDVGGVMEDIAAAADRGDLDNLRQELSIRNGAFRSDAEWNRFLENYVDTRMNGMTTMEGTNYIASDWFRDLDANAMNTLVQIAGMSPAAQYEPSQPSTWESLMGGAMQIFGSWAGAGFKTG